MISLLLAHLTCCEEPDEPGCCVKVTCASLATPASRNPLLSACLSTRKLCHPLDPEAAPNHLFFSRWFFSVTVHRRLLTSTADESHSSLVLIRSPPQSISNPPGCLATNTWITLHHFRIAAASSLHCRKLQVLSRWQTDKFLCGQNQTFCSESAGAFDWKTCNSCATQYFSFQKYVKTSLLQYIFWINNNVPETG